MDGVSIAASIVGIATAGIQVSIKLVNLATQVDTASDRVSSIANDISLTSGVIHQLGELMNQKTTDSGTTILNQRGLDITKTSTIMCERVFQEIDKETKKASAQLRKVSPGQGRMSGEKIKLSTLEKATWPFLQPNINDLRADLRDAKSTLMLMLQVASLALNKRMFDASLSKSEHEDYVRTIVALELQRREEQKKVNMSHEGLLDREESSSLENSSSRGAEQSWLDWSNEDSNVRGICPTFVSNPWPLPNTNSEIQNDLSTDLQLFLLKPEVIDFSDKIELYWSIQDANTQQFAIREHMAKNKEDGLPSVIDMLQQLHAYERTMVDSETSKVDRGSILSLKRTKTDIACRDMLFKAVPGLQFVIKGKQRQAPIALAPRDASSIGGCVGYLRESDSAILSDDDSSRKWMIPQGSKPSSIGSSYPSLQAPDDVGDGQEDKEAEALVTELLAKYTILDLVGLGFSRPM